MALLPALSEQRVSVMVVFCAGCVVTGVPGVVGVLGAAAKLSHSILRPLVDVFSPSFVMANLSFPVGHSVVECDFCAWYPADMPSDMVTASSGRVCRAISVGLLSFVPHVSFTAQGYSFHLPHYCFWPLCLYSTVYRLSCHPDRRLWWAAGPC